MPPIGPWMHRAVLAVLVASLLLGGEPAGAATTWDEDFAGVVAETDRVGMLNREELEHLVAECDRLRPGLEALPETPRKVYRRRLERTRDLYLFALETIKSTESSPEEPR